MRSSFPSVFTLVAFVAAQLPLPAQAQNAAQAEVLFKEGKDLMQAKKYDEACKRLTASFKLDAQPNVELVQGLCFQQIGRTASAYNAFLDASTLLPRGEPAQKYAADQAKALESQLLKVKVQMQPVVPVGVAIRFDDEQKTRDKDFVDVDIALDPGDHDVFVTAPGKQDFTKHFILKNGEPTHVVIVNMVDKTKEELDKEKGGGNVVVDKTETSWSTVKTLGMIGIIVGGVAVVGAGATQILAFVFQGDSTTEAGKAPGCAPSDPMDPLAITNQDCQSAHNYHSQALSAQSAAIGIGIAGGVVLVAGIIMFLVGGNVTKTPEKQSFQVLPLLGPNLAGMGLSGTF